ncbi:hypothetical protein BSZ21_00910 [Bradyrhizobium canariense]|uniref:lipopolysaccharide biosynthesis protein n=1 Tax=Bradyrhizobium canariense TaxID=255045 RepID=UPI000A19442E|nr:oligosaccharide flippase family protein [Bradyrhizobium canariense]OSI80026.1 hypothetical protein BSZ21_00910 [Bradyrhizobium canariense]
MAGRTSRKIAPDLLGNSAWNATAFLVAVVLNLAILPFVITHLGPTAFGVAGLVTACIAPALVFSNALGVSTVRELALRLDPSDREDAQRLFATSVMLALCAGGLISLFVLVVGPSLARVAFHLASPAADDLAWAFALAAMGWLCQCVAAVFVAVFTARQNYKRIALVGIASTVVSTLSMLLLIPAAPNASTFLGCQALGLASGLLLAVAWSCGAFGQWLARPELHRDAFARLARLGIWQVAAQGGALLAGQADRYLLGALLQPQFVGFYGVAQRLQEATYIGILKLGEILFPFFSTLQKESEDRKVDLLFRSSWILNILAASALGALIPVAGPLLHVWTGAEVAAEAARLLVVLSIAGIIGSSANVFGFYLLAQGQSRCNALIALITGGITLVTSAIVLPGFGWQAAGWSACAGMIAQMATIVMLLRRSFDLSGMWPRVVHCVLMPLGIGIALALALRYGLDRAPFQLAPSWWSVGVVGAVTAAIIFVAGVAASQLGPYRSACWQDLRAIVRRFVPLKAI